MPNLPTTNLTGQFDASIPTKLFKTFVSGGPNTGVPVSGDDITAWQDNNVSQVAKKVGASGSPRWLASAPLLRLPSMNFDKSRSPTERSQITDLSAGNIALSSLITNSAYTIFCSIYIRSITGGSGTIYNNDCIYGDLAGYMGLFAYNDGGGNKLGVYNYDGSVDSAVINVNINTQYIVMARHEGGNIYISLNGGTEVSSASGNTQVMTANFGIGNGFGIAYDGQLGEIAIYNAAISSGQRTQALNYFTNKWIGSPIPYVPTGNKSPNKGGKGPKGLGSKQVFGTTGLIYWDPIVGFGQ